MYSVMDTLHKHTWNKRGQAWRINHLSDSPSRMRWLQFLPPQDQPATGVPCGEQRGSSATRSSSKSRFPGNWKNCWKFALSSALKRGRHDPYVQGLAEPPGPRAKLAEVGLRLCFLASHPSPGAGPACCCFKFCSSCYLLLYPHQLLRFSQSSQVGVESSCPVHWEKRTQGVQRWEVLGVGPRGVPGEGGLAVFRAGLIPGAGSRRRREAEDAGSSDSGASPGGRGRMKRRPAVRPRGAGRRRRRRGRRRAAAGAPGAGRLRRGG